MDTLDYLLVEAALIEEKYKAVRFIQSELMITQLLHRLGYDELIEFIERIHSVAIAAEESKTGQQLTQGRA